MCVWEQKCWPKCLHVSRGGHISHQKKMITEYGQMAPLPVKNNSSIKAESCEISLFLKHPFFSFFCQFWVLLNFSLLLQTCWQDSTRQSERLYGNSTYNVRWWPNQLGKNSSAWIFWHQNGKYGITVYFLIHGQHSRHSITWACHQLSLLKSISLFDMTINSSWCIQSYD